MNALFSTQFDAIVRQARRSANVVTLAKRRTNILNAFHERERWMELGLHVVRRQTVIQQIK